METAHFALIRRSPLIRVMLLDHDVSGGSSFLGALRNLNELFPELSADFGSYLGKYWSVFDAVKRIFLSETCSARLAWGEFPANYSFKENIHEM